MDKKMTTLMCVLFFICVGAGPNDKKDEAKPATSPTVAVAPAPEEHVFYPDKNLTPGDTDLKATKEDICKVGYTAKVRNVPMKMKKFVMDLYKLPESTLKNYEIDHFISLELGGSNAQKNLWPQPYCNKKVAGKTCFGAREKDVVETDLHRRICKGEIDLAAAQEIIKTDWYAEYKKIKAAAK